MSQKEYELTLFKSTLDWAVSRNLLPDSFIPYYNDYHQQMLTHVSIVNEEWSEHNMRHGASSIRGTTSELLTAALIHSRFQYDIDPVLNKNAQKWGSDLVATKGAKKGGVFSVKTGKPRNEFIDGQLDTRINLFADWFKSATWRVNFLSIAVPEDKHIYLGSYGLIASIYCKINERDIPKPNFPNGYVPLYVRQFIRKNPTGLGFFDLTKDIDQWETTLI